MKLVICVRLVTMLILFVCCYQAQAAALPLAGPDKSALMAANKNNNNYNPQALGRLSFQQDDLSEINDDGVYDPGDELLRALNAENAMNGHELGTSPKDPEYADTVFNELELASKYDLIRNLENDLLNEQDIVTKSTMLMKLIEDPTLQILPIVYLDDDVVEVSDSDSLLNMNEVSKRSRYYRRYPWKRHSRNRKYFTSSTYEPELRYACTPTKEDVFKLLVNLHENRKGNHSKTVSFCNRKRPAKAIFTNIRFLG